MRKQPELGQKIRKAFTSKVLESSDADRTIVHVITARVVDRDGDVIEPRGGRFENFRKNPTVLFGHDSWSFPIGRNLALEVSDMEIRALTQYAGLDQANGQAETAYRMARDGFLPAWSIGFMPITWSEDKALPDQDGWWFKEWELYEYSNVCIPSNPEALSRMVKAFSLPAGATEKDLLDAVKQDRQRYFDVGAAVLKAPAGDDLVLELGALKQRVTTLEAKVAAPAAPAPGPDRTAVERGIREAFAEFQGAGR